jgi:hypothetical protein
MVRASSEDWSTAIYRAFALAIGANLIDYGLSAGVVKKSIPMSAYSKQARYRGRAAVAFGLVAVAFGGRCDSHGFFSWP